MQRPDRQHVRVVGPYRQRPGGLVKLKSQFSTLKFHAILSAEQGYEHFLVQVTAIGVPFDVEPAGVYRLLAPFENVEPQRIIGPAATHVIRDHIENLSEVLELQRSAHASERSVIAEFGIELRMIDNVIAVQTAGTCPQIGRCIQMTHTQLRQIGRQGCRIIKTEMRMELQPIGGTRNHGGGLRRRLQRTAQGPRRLPSPRSPSCQMSSPASSGKTPVDIAARFAASISVPAEVSQVSATAPSPSVV